MSSTDYVKQYNFTVRKLHGCVYSDYLYYQCSKSSANAAKEAFLKWFYRFDRPAGVYEIFAVDSKGVEVYRTTVYEIYAVDSKGALVLRSNDSENL